MPTTLGTIGMAAASQAASTMAQQAIGSTASMLDGGHSARKQARYQDEINRNTALWNMENITIPLFNKENAEWQRRFNAENTQWYEQQQFLNSYNSPSAQIQRLREAGINPAGIGSIQNPIAQGAEVSSPYTPQAAGYPAQAAMLQETPQDTALKRAQVGAITANTEKTLNESKNEAIKSTYYDAYWQGTLALQGVDIELRGADKELKAAQRGEVIANMKYLLQRTLNAKTECALMIEQMAEISERIKQVQANTEYQHKVNAWFDQHQEAEIKRLYSEIRRNTATEAEAYATAKNYYSLARKYMLEGNYQEMQNGVFEASMDALKTSLNAQYNAETDEFKLRSNKATWEDQTGIYKTERQLEFAVKANRMITDRIKQYTTSIKLGVLGEFGISGPLDDKFNVPWADWKNPPKSWFSAPTTQPIQGYR